MTYSLKKITSIKEGFFLILFFIIHIIVWLFNYSPSEVSQHVVLLNPNFCILISTKQPLLILG